MKFKLKIFKPGSDLVNLLAQDGDTTHFGGLSELRYFVDYLGAVPINSVLDISPEDIVLISNSNQKFHNQVENLKAKKVIQILSDLNLIIPDDLLGNNIKLCQIPNPKEEGWCYSLIEKSILLFQERKYNAHKKYTLVYGGGGRNGNRDKQYIDFLNPSRNYVSLLFTSSAIFNESDKIRNKISFNQLQNIYSETKYGIVISDPEYYEAGMLTQRYWEYCLNGMVAFIDTKYDKFKVIANPNDFIRVNYGEELEEKINYLENHPNEKEIILTRQNEMIDKEIEFMKGKNIKYLKKLIFDIF